MIDDEGLGQTGATTRVDLRIRLRHFHLPPVESALAVGKKAPIGPNAMLKALEELLPGTYKKIAVEHATIEALILRESHLRLVPEQRLVRVLLKHAEPLMSECEMLHIDIAVQVRVEESLEV